MLDHVGQVGAAGVFPTRFSASGGWRRRLAGRRCSSVRQTSQLQFMY